MNDINKILNRKVSLKSKNSIFNNFCKDSNPFSTVVLKWSTDVFWEFECCYCGSIFSAGRIKTINCVFTGCMSMYFWLTTIFITSNGSNSSKSLRIENLLNKILDNQEFHCFLTEQHCVANKKITDIEFLSRNRIHSKTCLKLIVARNGQKCFCVYISEEDSLQ